jgi:hypothetical protein
MGNLAAMNDKEVEDTIDVGADADDDDDTKPAAWKKRKTTYVVGSTTMVDKHEELMIQKENNKKLSLKFIHRTRTTNTTTVRHVIIHCLTIDSFLKFIIQYL